MLGFICWVLDSDKDDFEIKNFFTADVKVVLTFTLTTFHPPLRQCLENALCQPVSVCSISAETKNPPHFSHALTFNRITLVMQRVLNLPRFPKSPVGHFMGSQWGYPAPDSWDLPIRGTGSDSGQSAAVLASAVCFYLAHCLFLALNVIWEESQELKSRKRAADHPA